MCDTKARLEGKVAIVTGGSSGIGYETAKNLAHRGARVIIASRNETKLMRAKKQIQKVTGNDDIAYGRVDFGSFKSVRDFATNTLISEERIDILINNAGAIGLPDKLTEDGLSLTMQVNYFGAFLLTYLLLPLLKSSAPSRIINGSASAMYIGHIDFDHWNDIGRYNSIEALANSKLAIALFSAELHRKLNEVDITVNSFDPFIVANTDILNNYSDLVRNVSQLFVNLIGQPKEEVAQQISYLASDPEMEKISGMHYKFCRKWINHWLVSDEVLTQKLWETSKRIVKISPDEDWE